MNFSPVSYSPGPGMSEIRLPNRGRCPNEKPRWGWKLPGSSGLYWGPGVWGDRVRLAADLDPNVKPDFLRLLISSEMKSKKNYRQFVKQQKLQFYILQVQECHRQWRSLFSADVQTWKIWKNFQASLFPRDNPKAKVWFVLSQQQPSVGDWSRKLAADPCPPTGTSRCPPSSQHFVHVRNSFRSRQNNNRDWPKGGEQALQEWKSNIKGHRELKMEIRGPIVLNVMFGHPALVVLLKVRMQRAPQPARHQPPKIRSFFAISCLSADLPSSSDVAIMLITLNYSRVKRNPKSAI